MIYTITVGHVPSRIWGKSIERYHKTKHGGLEYKHVFLDNLYAINKEKNSKENKIICESSGVEYVCDGSNLGNANGFNYVTRYLNQRYTLNDNDILIGYDPDSTPVSNGWDMALVTTFLDQSTGWATLYAQWLVNQFKYTERKINQVRVHETHQAIMNSICAIRYSFFRDAGGFSEVTNGYGGLEVKMWPHFARLNKKWVFTADYWEDHEFHHLQDEEYKRFKWYKGHTGQCTGTFEDYVNIGSPIF